MLDSNDVEADYVKPWCYYYLADMYREAGETEKAKKEYNIAYEFEGKDTLAEFEFLKPIKEIKETDLLGNNVVSLKSNENKCIVEFKPFQIYNLIVSFI